MDWPSWKLAKLLEEPWSITAAVIVAAIGFLILKQVVSAGAPSPWFEVVLALVILAFVWTLICIFRRSFLKAGVAIRATPAPMLRGQDQTTSTSHGDANTGTQTHQDTPAGT